MGVNIMKYKYLDEEYNIRVIRKNNKNTYIRFKDNEIVVTTNYFVTNKQIMKLINDNTSFLNKVISKSNIKKDDDDFYLFGNIYNIIYINKIEQVEITNNKIYANDIKSLDKFLSKYIYDIYLDRLNFWASVFEEKLPKYNLKIRKMKSRWGVCNIKNKNITLNLELSKYNIKYLDYVIIHELSHFMYPNHSHDFWLLVSKYCSNYKEIRKEMKNFSY